MLWTDADAVAGLSQAPVIPAYPGLYANSAHWRDLHVWEPEFAPVPRVETRCMAHIGSAHCSLESGHGGSHHAEKIGLWWSDGT